MLDYNFEFSEFMAGRRSSRPNPFERDHGGNIRSMAGISALIQSDPEMARRLCQLAGEKLWAWFPDNPQ